MSRFQMVLTMLRNTQASSHNMIKWAKTEYSLICGYLPLGGTYCLHIFFALNTEAENESETLITNNQDTIPCHK
jgi:hypothetical protein